MPPQSDLNGNVYVPPKVQTKFATYPYVSEGSFGIVPQNAVFFFFGQIMWLYSYYHIFHMSFATWIWRKLEICKSDELKHVSLQ